jgi:hypothetical protein
MTAYIYPDTLSMSAWLTGYYSQVARAARPESDRTSAILSGPLLSPSYVMHEALEAFARQNGLPLRCS